MATFKPTSYKLENVADGRVFLDEGWTLADPQATSPSLVRAIYQTRFTPREDLKGLYRYADWLPICRTLKNSHAPVTYKSKGLAELLGLSNLYITFSGYWPKIGARMETCSFKETEAFSVCARMPKKNNKQVLVVQSAGNTARAFARVCSDNNIPIVICIPQDNINDLWFAKPLSKCVKVIATPKGTDYYDAIALGEKLAKNPRFVLEGGAKNVARRDGMGTTVLSAVETIGRIPDAYFQAVGSGTGAIAAWENAERLAADGRFGKNNMRIYACQNAPYTLMYDSWKAGQRELVPITPEESRRDAEIILATVLSNRKPPYSIAGGLYDVLKASGGDMYLANNDQIVKAILQFFKKEGVDIFPAAACAVACLAQAVENGDVKKDEVIMLNITGGGMLNATNHGAIQKEPDLILSQDLPAEEIIAAVDKLF
ncbi:MAG: cysteate synthase [Bacteroidales bacterium]|nr:cysteate synthase [Bacteroidales bacterium]